MKVLSFFLLMAALSMTTARTWKEGDNGLVRWDLDCAFKGSEIIAKKDIPGDHCGRFCLVNDAPSKKCTHFTYKSGTCYLYHSTINWLVESEYLSACGFIPDRTAQKIDWKNGRNRYEFWQWRTTTWEKKTITVPNIPIYSRGYTVICSASHW